MTFGTAGLRRSAFPRLTALYVAGVRSVMVAASDLPGKTLHRMKKPYQVEKKHGIFLHLCFLEEEQIKSLSHTDRHHGQVP